VRVTRLVLGSMRRQQSTGGRNARGVGMSLGDINVGELRTDQERCPVKPSCASGRAPRSAQVTIFAGLQRLEIRVARVAAALTGWGRGRAIERAVTAPTADFSARRRARAGWSRVCGGVDSPVSIDVLPGRRTTHAQQRELPAGVTIRDGRGTATRRCTTHIDERALAGRDLSGLVTTLRGQCE